MNSWSDWPISLPTWRQNTWADSFQRNKQNEVQCPGNRTCKDDIKKWEWNANWAANDWRIICNINIGWSPAQLPCIHSQHAHIEAIAPCSFQQANSLTHIGQQDELEWIEALQLHRRDPYTAGRTWVTGRCSLGCRCTSIRCYFRSSHKHLDRLPLQRPRWIGTQLLKDSTANAEELLVVFRTELNKARHTGSPSSPAIFAGTSSPSGLYSLLIPMGAKRIGTGIWCPNNSAEIECYQLKTRQWWRRKRLTGQVARVSVDEHTGDDAPSIKCFSRERHW